MTTRYAVFLTADEAAAIEGELLSAIFAANLRSAEAERNQLTRHAEVSRAQAVRLRALFDTLRAAVNAAKPVHVSPQNPGEDAMSRMFHELGDKALKAVTVK